MAPLIPATSLSSANSDTAEHKDYDAGKKAPGIKRHSAADSQGLPHAIAVTTAEATDRKEALQALRQGRPKLKRVVAVLADAAYVSEPCAQGVGDMVEHAVEVQIAKRSELHTFKVMPKRWAVERSFAWLDNCRRLCKNCERKLNTVGVWRCFRHPRRKASRVTSTSTAC